MRNPPDSRASRRPSAPCSSRHLLVLLFVTSSLGLIPGRVEGAIVEHTVPPKITDPSITTGLDDHYAVLNTSVDPAEDLFVFLPGTNGKPSDTRLILQEAAANGFRAIGLMYQNNAALVTVCPVANTDVGCFDKIRQEIVTGDDVSSAIAVTRANSIENRILRLLLWLDANYPTEGWGRWVVYGRPDWSRMRLSGWSQGGAHAAYIARDRVVAGVIGFSSPGDWDIRLDKAPPWETAPHVTPASRYYGFTHVQDATLLWKYMEKVWAGLGMGLYGPPVSIDSTQPPYGGSHQLITDRPLPSVTGANFHRITIVDQYTPKEADGSPTFAPVWRAVAFWKSPERSTKLLFSGGRVSVSVTWKSQYTGEGGTAFALPQDDSFGYFYFVDASNPELFVKVLDFGGSTPYLLFCGGLTDYEYTATFTNVATGKQVSFHKAPGTFNGWADNKSLPKE